MLIRLAQLFAIAVSASVVLHADSFTFFATTTDRSTFNRPYDNGTSGPPAYLSAIGTAVKYVSQSFLVSSSGTYTISSTATTPANWDNFIILYSGSFNAATPLANAVTLNDDLNGVVGRAGFSVSLNSGIHYFLVTTGFTNTDSGTAANVITGLGAITLSPEPGTMFMIASGLGLLIWKKHQGGSW